MNKRVRPKFDGSCPERPLQGVALLKQDEATQAIPVSAFAALAMKGDEERIRAAGCDGYIAKPLAYRDFLAVISAQLVTVPL